MGTVRIPKPSRRMSATDAGFLYLERPHALLHIAALALLEGEIECGDVVERIEARLPWLTRYGQRAMSVPFSAGHPAWEDAPDFDVRDHVREWVVPAPGGEAEVADLCAALLAQPLDKSRPLWEMHVLRGVAGGRSAVFQKVHHCMIDGVSGAQLLEQILDRPDGEDPPAALVAAPRSAPDALARLGASLRDSVRHRFGATRALAAALARPARARASARRLLDGAFEALHLATRDIPQLPWNTGIGPRRVLSFTQLPMSGVKQIKSARGGTVNDVVLSVLAGGLHRYLRSQAIETDRLEVTALVPVSLRGEHEQNTLGNRISAMIVPLPVDVDSEVPRLSATRATTERLRTKQAWTGIDALLGMIDGVPAPLVAAAGRALRLGRVANVVATNVPGPRERRDLCGHALLSFYPVVPIADGLGLGLAVFSYAGTLFVGLNADARLVPDLDKLRQGIEESFSELVTTA